MDFGKLRPSREGGGEPSFEADEVKAAENEPGRDFLEAEDLLTSQQLDPLVGNPYRLGIQGELRAIDHEHRPELQARQLNELVHEYELRLAAVQRRIGLEYESGTGQLDNLLDNATSLTQALQWLRGYREARLADPNAVAQQVAKREDFRTLLRQEQGMMNDLKVLQEAGNTCAEYVREHWRKIRDDTIDVLGRGEHKVESIRTALVRGLVGGWLTEPSVAGRPARQADAGVVLRAIDSWFPPEAAAS